MKCYTADTPEKKRKLAERLKKKNPEFLKFYQEAAKVFGPAKKIRHCEK